MAVKISSQHTFSKLGSIVSPHGNIFGCEDSNVRLPDASVSKHVPGDVARCDEPMQEGWRGPNMLGTHISRGKQAALEWQAK